MTGKSLVPLNGGLTVTAPHTPNAHPTGPTITINATTQKGWWQNSKAKALWLVKFSRTGVGKWLIRLLLVVFALEMLDNWWATPPAPIAAKLPGVTTVSPRAPTLPETAAAPTPGTCESVGMVGTAGDCKKVVQGITTPAAAPAPQVVAQPSPTVALPRIPPQGQPQRQAPRQQAARPAPAYQPQSSAQASAPPVGEWRQMNQSDFDAIRQRNGR